MSQRKDTGRPSFLLRADSHQERAKGLWGLGLAAVRTELDLEGQLFESAAACESRRKLEGHAREQCVQITLVEQRREGETGGEKRMKAGDL